MWLKPIRSTWSVLTSICSICDSNLYTVYDQFSHRSAVYVTQTYTQYMISSHIDLQYMWLKPIYSIWSVLTSICSMWLKPIYSIWSVLTSICSICGSNLYTVYDQYSHRSVVYVAQTCTQYMTSTHIDLQCKWLKPIRSTWSVLTSICSTCDSNRYGVYDLYSHRSAVYVTQINRLYMISTHVDLQGMWLKSVSSIW